MSTEPSPSGGVPLPQLQKAGRELASAFRLAFPSGDLIEHRCTLIPEDLVAVDDRWRWFVDRGWFGGPLDPRRTSAYREFFRTTPAPPLYRAVRRCRILARQIDPCDRDQVFFESLLAQVLHAPWKAGELVAVPDLRRMVHLWAFAGQWSVGVVCRPSRLDGGRPEPGPDPANHKTTRAVTTRDSEKARRARYDRSGTNYSVLVSPPPFRLFDLLDRLGQDDPGNPVPVDPDALPALTIPVGLSPGCVLALGDPVPLPSPELLDLLRAMLECYPAGLSLREVEKIHTKGHIKLRDVGLGHPRFAASIARPGRRGGGGYRVRSVRDAIAALNAPPALRLTAG